MTNESITIVHRFWNYCNVLCDDDEIGKELDGALVRAGRLRGEVLNSAFVGRLV